MNKIIINKSQESLFIRETQTTPKVHFDPIFGVLEISGESYPIEAGEFWGPVIDWISRYFESGNRELTLNIKLNFYNVSTSKAIFQILNILDKYKSHGFNLKTNWYYPENDHYLKETWQEFIEDFSIPHSLISYKK